MILSRINPFNRLMSALFISLLFISCGSEKTAALPDPATSPEQVAGIVKGKKYNVERVGFYGALTINDKTEMEWIDTTVQNDRTTVDVVREMGVFRLHIGTDSTATVFSKGKEFAATWFVDDVEDKDMNEAKAIRLRTSYVDPEFSFNASSPMTITYSYVVKGINENELLVELPRTINNRRVVALFKTN